MALAQVNSYSPGSTDLGNVQTVVDTQRRNYDHVSLTNFDNTSEPEIELGSTFDINGALWEVQTADLAISGWAAISNGAVAYIRISGGVPVWTSTPPAWDAAKGGWYVTTVKYLPLRVTRTDATTWSNKRYIPVPNVLDFNVHGDGKVTIGTPYNLSGGTLEVKGTWSLIGRTIDTNSNDKNLRIGATHYTNAEEPITAVWINTSSAASILGLGGGTGDGNAATQISLYTAANNTTVTGTERMRINGGSYGNIAMGSGASNVTDALAGYTLQIFSTGTTPAYTLYGNTDSGFTVNDGFRVGLNADLNASLLLREDANMLLYTNSLLRLQINGGTSAQGNIGMGTSASVVTATANHLLQIIGNSNQGTGDPVGLIIRDISTTAGGSFVTTPLSFIGFYLDDTSGGGAGIKAKIATFTDATGSTMGLTIHTDNGAGLIETGRLTTAGNLAIGGDLSNDAHNTAGYLLQLKTNSSALAYMQFTNDTTGHAVSNGLVVGIGANEAGIIKNFLTGSNITIETTGTGKLISAADIYIQSVSDYVRKGIFFSVGSNVDSSIISIAADVAYSGLLIAQNMGVDTVTPYNAALHAFRLDIGNVDGATFGTTYALSFREKAPAGSFIAPFRISKNATLDDLLLVTTTGVTMAGTLGVTGASTLTGDVTIGTGYAGTGITLTAAGAISMDAGLIVGTTSTLIGLLTAKDSITMYDGVGNADRTLTFATDASILWDESEDRFDFDKSLNIQLGIHSPNHIGSDSTTYGALFDLLITSMPITGQYLNLSGGFSIAGGTDMTASYAYRNDATHIQIYGTNGSARATLNTSTGSATVATMVSLSW